MVPYLLGYHPTEALVAIIKKPDRPLPRVVSLPLSEPTTMLLNHLTLQIPEKASGIVLIGYGPATHQTKIAAVSEVLQLLAPVVGRFLYTDGILTCLTPACTCSAAEGVPVDPRSTRLSTRAAPAWLPSWPSPAAWPCPRGRTSTHSSPPTPLPRPQPRPHSTASTRPARLARRT
ncbi:DUF4192 family protein [Actinoplanes campanulatus]|nr:hypothetical protein GCM10010109_64540 [Actinoplanes campanulatus]